MTKTSNDREPRQDARAACAKDGQHRFKPVAIPALAAACAVRGTSATRKTAVSDLPAILRDDARD